MHPNPVQDGELRRRGSRNLPLGQQQRAGSRAQQYCRRWQGGQGLDISPLTLGTRRYTSTATVPPFPGKERTGG